MGHFHSPPGATPSTSRNGHDFLRSSRKLPCARPFQARRPGRSCPPLPLPLPLSPPSSLPPFPPQLQPPRSFRPEWRHPGPTILSVPLPGFPASEARPVRSGRPPPPHPPPASSLPPPPLPRSPCPSPLRYPGRGPAPTAARKDAAWVPCQASECAAPPSRARNAAGRRGRRRHPALRPAL